MAKILIVDENASTAARIAQELKEAGHTCAVRTSGKDILDIAKKESLDLLVLDVMLPDVSGFEVCRQIRRDSSLYKLPILFLSAMDNPEEVQHGLEQGADDYVTKPFDLHQFTQRVEALLRVSASEDYVDRVTGLPDAEGSRKRVQQFISRQNAFAVVYVELMNLRSFATSQGDAVRDKALRHLARALTFCGSNFREREFLAGHLGAGFFICAVPAFEAESYCKKVQRSWRKHLSSFYESLGIVHRLDGSSEGVSGVPKALDLLFCMTAREGNESVSAQQMLDTLSRIRRTVGDVTVGGIHVDRRLG